MKKYIKWEYFERFMKTTQFLIVCFGIVFSIIQLKDITNNQLNRKNELVLKYYDKINSGIDRKISITINQNKKILKPQGRFTTDNLDDYIDDLFNVGDSLNRGLLDQDLVCSNFYDLTMKAWNNKEIQKYINDVRKEYHDDSYFTSFDDLYSFIKTCN